YESRSFNSANSTEDCIRGGKSDNSFQITLKDNSSITSELSASYVKNSDYANSRYSSLLDGKLLSSADIHRRESVGSFKLNSSASWSKVFKTSKVRLNIRGTAILDKNDLNGWQLDTAATSTLRTHLVSTGSGHDNSYSGSIGLGIPLGSKLWRFSLNQSIKYDDTKAGRLSDDLMNGLVDTVNSYDYTVDMLTWSSGINLQYNNYARKDGGISFVMMKMNWEHSNQQRKEFMPENYHISRTFRVPSMSVTVSYKMTDFKNMTFSLVAQPERMPIEQLREELDNRNPLQLRAGNPMLKRPVKVGMQWNSTLISKKGNNMNIVLGVYKTENAITSHTRFFDVDTKLSDYNDYVAIAGSSLTTPENSSKSWLASARMAYSFRLKPLRSTMNLDLSHSYQNLPIYVHSMPASNKRHSSNVGVSVSTSFSTKFETTVSYRPILSFDDNSMEKNKTFSQNLNMTLRYVSSKGYMVTFDARWHDYYTKIGEGYNNLILDPSVGKRFGKKQNFSVKVEGHDLLNQTKIFSVNMEDDYVVMTRRYSLGRYVICRLEYKF
ncbi:MAG: hypothetical protein K2M86_01735, partial [Odoribacter sp.]|nr:hypothetical protein [Odoribacter sp.]